MYVVSFACISIVGYGILLSDASSGVHYFGCFLVAMGLYVAVGLPVAWLPNNCPQVWKENSRNRVSDYGGECEWYFGAVCMS